ncbi:MAG: hypothetical protein ACRDY0_10490 [Acidimicrobiales bacterium]
MVNGSSATVSWAAAEDNNSPVTSYTVTPEPQDVSPQRVAATS